MLSIFLMCHPELVPALRPLHSGVLCSGLPVRVHAEVIEVALSLHHGQLDPAGEPGDVRVDSLTPLFQSPCWLAALLPPPRSASRGAKLRRETPSARLLGLGLLDQEVQMKLCLLKAFPLSTRMHSFSRARRPDKGSASLGVQRLRVRAKLWLSREGLKPQPQPCYKALTRLCLPKSNPENVAEPHEPVTPLAPP